ncbi:MAG: lysophospholipid acyltransferase family protein [Gemmatimonadota bacterium]|nr:lysophospholipid acyltransferase family protein [Gemmatimonadota bacterium]
MNVRGHEHRPAIWWAWATVRTIYCWIALAALTLFVGSVYLAVGWIAPDSRFVRGLEHLWVGTILRASFVDLEVEGLDRVEAGTSYIVMANHRSMYDIPVLHYILDADRDLRWIGKQELLKVPVFGWVFGMSRHISIDRQHREKGIAAMKRAADESAAGVSFVVMPEGTRSRDGRLLPFKKGGFHLAIDTRLPILPVAIVGSEKLMPKGTWWILPGRIEVHVRSPIATTGLDKSDVEPLRDRVRGVIRDALTDLPEESRADRRRR